MNWLTCPNCKHKMFRYADGGTMAISIKCPSCKIVFNVLISDKEVAYGESET